MFSNKEESAQRFLEAYERFCEILTEEAQDKLARTLTEAERQAIRGIKSFLFLEVFERNLLATQTIEEAEQWLVTRTRSTSNTANHDVLDFALPGKRQRARLDNSITPEGIANGYAHTIPDLFLKCQRLNQLLRLIEDMSGHRSLLMGGAHADITGQALKAPIGNKSGRVRVRLSIVLCQGRGILAGVPGQVSLSSSQTVRTS